MTYCVSTSMDLFRTKFKHVLDVQVITTAFIINESSKNCYATDGQTDNIKNSENRSQ